MSVIGTLKEGAVTTVPWLKDAAMNDDIVIDFVIKIRSRIYKCRLISQNKKAAVLFDHYAVQLEPFAEAYSEFFVLIKNITKLTPEWVLSNIQDYESFQICIGISPIFEIVEKNIVKQRLSERERIMSKISVETNVLSPVEGRGLRTILKRLNIDYSFRVQNMKLTIRRTSSKAFAEITSTLFVNNSLPWFMEFLEAVSDLVSSVLGQDVIITRVHSEVISSEIVPEVISTAVEFEEIVEESGILKVENNTPLDFEKIKPTLMKILERRGIKPIDATIIIYQEENAYYLIVRGIWSSTRIAAPEAIKNLIEKAFVTVLNVEASADVSDVIIEKREISNYLVVVK